MTIHKEYTSAKNKRVTEGKETIEKIKTERAFRFPMLPGFVNISLFTSHEMSIKIVGS